MASNLNLLIAEGSENQSESEGHLVALQRIHSSPISAFKGLIDYSREYTYLEYLIYLFYSGSLCFLFM